MSMIHINRNRESLGKFTDQEVADGLKSGKFLGSDLAWRDPMPSWQALSTFSDLPEALDEKAELAPALPQAELALGRINFSECFSKAWSCYKSNLAPLLIGVLLLFVISFGLFFISQFAEVTAQKLMGKEDQAVWVKAIAVVVWIFFWGISTLVSALLSGGIAYFFIRSLRDNPKLEDLFEGFKGWNWFALLGVSLIWGFITVVLAAILLGPAAFISSQTGSQMPVFIGAALAVCAMIYFSPIASFSFPLVIDRRLRAFDAVSLAFKTVRGNWFSAFGLILIHGLLGLLGILLCCIGILFTTPLGYLIWSQGYRQLFGDPDPEKPEL